MLNLISHMPVSLIDKEHISVQVEHVYKQNTFGNDQKEIKISTVTHLLLTVRQTFVTFNSSTSCYNLPRTNKHAYSNTITHSSSINHSHYHSHTATYLYI
jgi:hypothetical protein